MCCKVESKPPKGKEFRGTGSTVLRQPRMGHLRFSHSAVSMYYTAVTNLPKTGTLRQQKSSLYVCKVDIQDEGVSKTTFLPKAAGKTFCKLFPANPGILGYWLTTSTSLSATRLLCAPFLRTPAEVRSRWIFFLSSMQSKPQFSFLDHYA